MRTNLFEGKLANRATYWKWFPKNQSIVRVEDKDKMGRVYAILAHSHPLWVNPYRVNNYATYLHRNKTDGIDLPDYPTLEKLKKY